MRPNPWLTALRAGDVTLGGWITNPSTINAEIMGSAGFEYVAIDTQHGAIDYTTMLPLLQVLAIGEATPIVRVPSCDSAHIGKALDAGARAVIVPMVNDRETCQAAMSFTRYAPEGVRSYGPTRAVLVEGDDYFSNASEQISMIPMIETVQAIDNIDEILDVPGVEAIYVGPADLSISLGLPPALDSPALDEAIESIIEACARHGVAPGVHANSSLCAKRVTQGFRMVTVSADIVALRTQVNEDLALARGSAGGSVTSAY